jgi:uncharacterized protein (DUF1778 family)
MSEIKKRKSMHREARMALRVSELELKLFRAAATRLGLNVSAWIRMVGIKRAKELEREVS